MEPLEPQTLNQFTTVTNFSKVLATVLFVGLPFVGLYIGYTFAPEKVVEVERVVVHEVEKVPTPEVKGIIATTTVDMGQYTVRYHTRAIEVIDDRGEVLQIIPWDASGLAGLTSKESLVIPNQDINYDHYLDLGILRAAGYGGVNQFYEFYLWDPTSHQLEKEDSLGMGPIEFVVSNPTVDIENRTITSSMKSAKNWTYEEYQFTGTEYESVREWTETWD